MMVTPELWAKVFGQGFYAAGGLELALGGRAQYEFAAPQPRPLPTQDTHVDVTAAPIQTKKSHHFDGSLGPFTVCVAVPKTFTRLWCGRKHAHGNLGQCHRCNQD
jgi:hypothetical protein